MSTPIPRYLIAVLADQIPAANQAATAWDPTGGAHSFLAPMLCLVGADPTVATHSGVHLRIDDTVAPAIQAAIEEDFPGAIFVQNDDPDAALAQAGLARVVTQLP